MEEKVFFIFFFIFHSLIKKKIFRDNYFNGRALSKNDTTLKY